MRLLEKWFRKSRKLDPASDLQMRGNTASQASEPGKTKRAGKEGRSSLRAELQKTLDVENLSEL